MPESRGPDWRRFVRTHVRLPPDGTAPEERMLAELADHLEDATATEVRPAPRSRSSYPSAVTGSITRRTSVTVLAGNPLRCACSWMSVSLSAIYTQKVLSPVR